MSRGILLPSVLAVAAACMASTAQAAKLKLPPWLAEASLRQVSSATKDTAAIALHDEAVLSVASNGRMTKTVRQAFRVVTRDGRSVAGAAIPYDSATQKITDFKAWLVRPGGEGKTYNIREAVDAALAKEAVYSEMRQLVFSAYNDAYEDCVFACEYTMDDRGLFARERWFFQAGIPVALSRLTFKIPKDWSVTAKTANHPEIEPVVNSATGTHTWELRDLPAVKPEPLCPSYPRVVPYVNVDVVPPAGMKNPPLMTFRDWTAVSVYTTNLYIKPCTPDATVEAKARELLATAGPGLWDRINALARHAQAINYVAIDTNVGRGGGMTPRAASDVLKTGYGVCRDKVALLCALLKAAGIESYPAVAYSGDRYQITGEWPAPGQFNHVINAIKIDDPSIQSPAIVEHPVFGRLLFFDPTDYYTPLGDIDYRNQGSLVLAGDKGELVRLPFTAPADNHLARTVTAEITESGAVGGRVVENFTGQSAAMERAAYRSPRGKYADTVRDWINSTVRAAKVLKTDVVDEQEQGTFAMTAEFVAPGYAQSMRGKLLIFKPAIMSRRNFVPLTQPDRMYPVVLEPQSYDEASDIKIPDNFKVDELPPQVETQTSFGRYAAKCTYDEKTHQVQYRRTLVMSAAEIPASDYTTVRAFYETIRKAEQTPVVLGWVQ